jgi:autotransporter family porin
MNAHRLSCKLFGVFALAGLVMPLDARAQYTSDFQTNVISGVISNWTGDYYVGGANFADVLLIQNGGVLNSGWVHVGDGSGSSNNSMIVSGTGSAWTWNGSSGGPGDAFQIGNNTSGNCLVISNGGAVSMDLARIFGTKNTLAVTGAGSVCSNCNPSIVGISNSLVVSDGGLVIDNGGSINGSMNRVVVTGVGSVWSNSSLFSLADSGTANSGMISNGGEAVFGTLYVGRFGASNASVRVVDGGTLLNGALFVGDHGSSNSLTVAAGSVFATNVIVGVASLACDNWIQIDDGSVTVTSATTNAVF